MLYKVSGSDLSMNRNYRGLMWGFRAPRGKEQWSRSDRTAMRERERERNHLFVSVARCIINHSSRAHTRRARVIARVEKRTGLAARLPW